MQHMDGMGFRYVSWGPNTSKNKVSVWKPRDRYDFFSCMAKKIQSRKVHYHWRHGGWEVLSFVAVHGLGEVLRQLLVVVLFRWNMKERFHPPIFTDDLRSTIG